MLKKKRYLTILSVAVVSIMLGSLLYNNITQALKGKEPTEVEVTNFPLDEEGNLKTTMVQTSAESKIMLVFNETLTVSSSVTNFHYLASFNTSGFKSAYLMAKAQGTWQEGAQINIYVYDNNFGIQTSWGSFELETVPTYQPSWGSGYRGTYEIHSTSMDLYLRVYNSNVGFDGLLTIAVYLSS